MNIHTYKTKIKWTDNKGNGTSDYNSYSRNFTIDADSKYKKIKGSSDPNFMGDVSRYNPEDLLLSSLSACHMLWYLHLCSKEDIVVLNYIDECTAELKIDKNGSGQIINATLNPIVTITNADLIEKAEELHAKASEMCFIANSVNFTIAHIPTIVVEN